MHDGEITALAAQKFEQILEDVMSLGGRKRRVLTELLLDAEQCDIARVRRPSSIRLHQDVLCHA